ncbi:MAG: hypothetical protein ACLQDY_02430 [Streptosporangiaceae bacterium]
MGEPGDVAGVADDGPGADRAGPGYLGHGGSRRADRRGEFLPGLRELGVQAAQVVQELGGQVARRAVPAGSAGVILSSTLAA